MDFSYNGILKEASERMAKAVARLEEDMRGIRTGRASPGLVDHIKVDYYGSMTPISQLAQVSVSDAKTIVIKPFDASAVSSIEKAILASNLGITPQSDGKIIRLPVPMMTEEQRKKLVAHIKDLGEQQRIAVRNVRRDCNKSAQQSKKDVKITEDQEKDLEAKIQDLTKKSETQIDACLKKKSDELTTI
ncbi:MAG: ribosome recycling factor [Planctomycetes bacterium]|nr:ribosome recycling factor [Planctomycetota bacterium]